LRRGGKGDSKDLSSKDSTLSETQEKGWRNMDKVWTRRAEALSSDATSKARRRRKTRWPLMGWESWQKD